MLRSKHGFQAGCGLGLFFMGIQQLTFDMQYDLASVFCVLWMICTALFIVANGRRMLKEGMAARIQRERVRREKWLQGGRQVLKHRRVTQGT